MKTITPSPYYSQVLDLTEKATCHLAVDTSPKHARRSQRGFANWVNRLIKLLSQTFPGHHFEILHLNASEVSKAAEQTRDRHKQLALQIWIIEGKSPTSHGKIIREFVAVHSYDRSAKVYVSTTEYPHAGAAIHTGKTKVIESHVHHTTAPAAALIRKHEYHTYSKQQPATA
jgi:hypothetical protein